MWPALTILSIAALVILQFAWRRRFVSAVAALQHEKAKVEREHETAARETESRQAALFDSMIEGLLLLDEHGRIQLANRAFIELFGLGGDVRGKSILEALRSHELADLIQGVTPERQLLGHELRLPGLPERWLQINAAAIANRSAQSRGTVLVVHELTRLKQLERTRQEFVANVSHELRTPLSLIKGYTETLLDGAKDDPELNARFLQTIQRNAARLQFLIEDLLTISELESGRITMNLQPLSLRSAVEKVFSDLGSRAAAKNIKLSNQVADLMLCADADRLQQVLNNLTDNALKYGRSPGIVSVSARRIDAGFVEVAVADDGPGIPPESLERVFERFYRVDKARSREQGGTGLGLSIVKHIVQSHGGRVWVRSELGRGATFFFTLPAAEGTE